jgi:hypothetical protein
MRVLVRRRVGRVSVQVRMITVMPRGVQVKSRRAARGPQAQGYEHDAHGRFAPGGHGRRHARATPGQESARCEHDGGVAESPAEAEPGGHGNAGLATYEGGDRHHMIHFEGVGGPQDERRRVGGPGSFHVTSVQERVMTDTPHDQKPRIRLTTLSHGAG